MNLHPINPEEPKKSWLTLVADFFAIWALWYFGPLLGIALITSASQESDDLVLRAIDWAVFGMWLIISGAISYRLLRSREESRAEKKKADLLEYHHRMRELTEDNPDE